MTARRRVALAVLLAAAFVGSSCGTDEPSARLGATASPVASAASAAAPLEAAPVGAVVPASAVDAATPTSADRRAPVAAVVAADSAAPTVAVAAPDALALTAIATRSCVPVGGVVDVDISTAAGATLGLAAMYADHDPHGAMGFGEADADGRYVWRLLVPADAPRGEAMAVIGADLTAADGVRRAGHAVAPFTVAAAGGCG